MYFRIFICKDPEASSRGFSLAGIKVPLTSYCPESAAPDMLDLDGKPVYMNSPYLSYWKIPTSLLISAKPSLSSHLREVEELLVPTDWCDIAPIESLDEIKRG